MRYAQLVMGPAGSGKSTYCHLIHEHCSTMHRVVRVVNLDPAAEEFKYPVQADVRELVQLEDVMEAEDLRLGPNGGLVFCMEFLAKNTDWLEQQLCDDEDDYWLFDCPGQIELYTHLPIMSTIVRALHRLDFRVCGVFLIDSQFLVDAAKYFSGVLSAMSAMVQLEIPHVNVMTKMDLLSKNKQDSLEAYLSPDALDIASELSHSMPRRFRRLNEAIAGLIDDYSLVNFIPLDPTVEESMMNILYAVDSAIQYGEDLEPREPRDIDEDDEERDIVGG